MIGSGISWRTPSIPGSTWKPDSSLDSIRMIPRDHGHAPFAVQEGGESVRDYIERFHNLSFMCLAGMPLPMLLQTCRYNFFDKVKVRMGAVKVYTWKELIEQAEIAEKSAKKFETPKSSGESTAKAIIRLNLLIHQH